MRAKAEELSQELEREPPPVDPAELQEVRDFLKWVSAHHFTFLGYREYDLVQEGEEAGLEARPGLRPGDPSQRPADARSSACGRRRSSSRAHRTCSC